MKSELKMVLALVLLLGGAAFFSARGANLTQQPSLSSIPMTDSIEDRGTLTTPSGIGYSSNDGATKEVGEPDHAGKPGGASMWIEWVAPTNGIATFWTLGSTFDTLLAAYEGGVEGYSEIASDDDGGEKLSSRISFNVVAGETYAIVVDGYGGEEGLIICNWQFEETAESLPFVLNLPSNVVVALGDTVTFRVLAEDGVEYQWFFNGAAITGRRRPAPGLGDRYRINFALREHAGQYFVRIFKGTQVVDTAPISLQFNMEGFARTVQQVLSVDKLLDAVISSPGVPAFAGPTSKGAAATSSAVARSYVGTQIFNTYGAAKQPGEPNHCGVVGGASQWFFYEPPADGTAIISTAGSTFDTVLAVYTGPGDSFATLVEEACDNDSGPNGTSIVSFPATAGTIYWVAVDGVNGATGIVNLTYALIPPVVPSSLSLGGGGFAVSFTVAPEVPFVIERTTNFLNWVPVHSNVTLNSTYIFTDLGATGLPKAGYRLLQAP